MDTLFQIYLESQKLCAILDGYEAAHRRNAAANGPLREDLEEASRVAALAHARKELAQQVAKLAAADLDNLGQIEPLFIAIERLRGTLFGYEPDKEEQELLSRHLAIYNQEEQPEPLFLSAILLGLYYQPFALPLRKNLAALSPWHLKRYLSILLRQPHLMTHADEEAYVSFYLEASGWLLTLVEDSDNTEAAKRAALLQTLKDKMTFGAAYYLDQPVIELVHARAKLVEALVAHGPEKETYHASLNKRPVPRGSRKIRLGILSRNLGDYTDTRALYAMFHAFDPAIYEIYWYSLDIIDPTTRSDVTFFRKLYALIHKAVSLRGDACQMARTILQDDLDIFASGTAFSFGLKDLDRLLFHKLGRVQVALSELVPGSTGFASYDYLFAPKSNELTLQTYRAESTEQLKLMEGPVLWYERKNDVPRSPTISRQALGIPDNAVVYCAGAAANKQMQRTMQTSLRILQNVPNSVVLFYPFNPAWGGYYIGLTFLARLRAVMKQFPSVDPKRVIVVREVSPDDGDRLIQLSDVYLGSFPRGGATSAMLALHYHKPVVARRETWIHSHDDAVMLRCLGCEDLIGQDNDDVVAIASRLGLDTAWRDTCITKIRQRIDTAPFFQIDQASRAFQKLFDELIPTAIS